MAKKARKEHHEEHADESWLMPYADLLTLLLALFIVLYAMSSASASKFQAMAEAFDSVLNGGPNVLEHTSTTEKESMTQDNDSQSLEDMAKQASAKKNNAANETLAKLKQKEQEDLTNLKKQLDSYISKNGLSDQLETKLNQSQLKIVISDKALFASGEATVKPTSRVLAASIANILKNFPGYNIQVTGHTDNVPIANSDFKNNWDLSSARANNFMQVLLKNPKLDPERFNSIAAGEYHPVASNSSAAGRAENRRVEVSIIRNYQESKDDSIATIE
ncbi:flagellar motor protein MotB [Saccharibacillus sp. CPCC 101409]|uniref:flagellar motor protein MotB n=1 Tax=Saccharibacillus sp. CPCC 101409 TaxID=3058041 RepID=UPI002671CDD1|nr:flagellar motor protein MotB [Saccharibacillus sp. CPCC 101409]MDO3413153.1 flagellar motor protein MotB [Saccharibacillus sp. CPCC 101409]